MSAVISTKKTMANEGSTSSHRMLLIHEVEIVKIDPTKKSRFRVKITAGNEKPTETEEIIIDRVGVTLKWAMTKNLGLDPLTKISWELHGRRWPVSHFKVVGSVEKTLGELFVLFEGNNTCADIHLFSGSSDVAVLKISGQLDTPKNVMTHLVPSVKKPSEGSELLDSETLQKVFEVVKQMIDTLAEVHPAATIAWGFLSIGFEVVKKQRDTKNAIRELYMDMISVYEAFSKDDILQQRVRLQGIYNSLFKQTIECAMFIEGYAKKSGIGRLVTMDISDKAEKQCQAFIDLKSRLSMGYAEEAVIVTLGVQESVNVMLMRDRLRDLQPPQELGPKSRCMQGTRVATINTMVSWIAQCDGKTMWCKGLAGTGKSSLMGTLHDLLTADIGGRSRLAAFVRYDRIEYSNASKLITSIAYALGTFDVRIGMAISKVTETSRSVMTMTDLSRQFQLLLRGPLERVPDLVDEGPLVVVIDGLDECDPSSELLGVLAEGFGPKLPFMRLIVSSRPVHRIATAFEGQDCVYPLHLDTSSASVNRDIQFYLERELAMIHDNAFQEKCKDLDAVNELTARASGLFISAATAAKFVHAFPGISRLWALLDTEIPSDAAEALTTLYRTALDTLVSEPGANADIKKHVRSVLGAVLVTQTPPGMTVDVLDNLILDKGSPPSHHIVSMLGSVLSPETEDSPIRLIHKSLDDFLQDQSRCGDEWFVDVTLHRKAIAEQCQVASQSFLKTWSPTSDMDIGAIPAYISKYALFGVFWYSTFDGSDLEQFISFFRPYFLPWLDIAATDGYILRFEIIDTFCQQHGLTHMPVTVNIRDSATIHRVLESSTHLYHHLHHSSKESPLAGKVTLECMELKETEEWSPFLEPTGDNLNIDGVIFVDADGMEKYGFKIVNTTLVPLYVSLFFFDVSILEVVSYYQPGSVTEALPPGESLTIGYGMSGNPHSYGVSEGQEVDVSFLKLFFSTEYLDLSAIIQKSLLKGYHQSVPPPMRKLPALRQHHTMSVPIVQKWVVGAPQLFKGGFQF